MTNPYETYREVIQDYIEREMEVLIALQQLIEAGRKDKEEVDDVA